MNTSQTKLAVIIGLNVLVLGLAGCSTPERSSGQKYDDWRLSRRVKGDLNDAPTYKYKQVDVASFNGVVQLNGWVNTEDQRAKATEIAQRTKGVTQVINNLTLKPLPAGVQMNVPTPTGPERTPPGAGPTTQTNAPPQ